MTSKVFYMKTTKQSPDDMKRDSIEKAKLMTLIFLEKMKI